MDSLMLFSPAWTLASPCIVLLLKVAVQLNFQASHSSRGCCRTHHAFTPQRRSRLAAAHPRRRCTPRWNWPLDTVGWLLKLCPEMEERTVLCPSRPSPWTVLDPCCRVPAAARSGWGQGQEPSPPQRDPTDPTCSWWDRTSSSVVMRETSSFLEFLENLTSPAPALHPESFPSTGSPAVAASVLIFDLHDFPLRLSCNLNCWLLPPLLHGSDNQSCLSNIFPSVSTPTLYSQWSKITHPPHTPQPRWLPSVLCFFPS